MLLKGHIRYRMILRRKLIYRFRILEEHASYEYNVIELFVWRQDVV